MTGISRVRTLPGGITARLLAWGRREGVTARELWLLGAIMLVSAAVVAIYVIANEGRALAGDEPEYDIQGRLATEGKWVHSTTPNGIEHPSMWKAPGYPIWVGLWYTILGTDPERVFLVQALLLAPLAVGLTWLLGRRLFGPRVGLAAAAVVAIYPFAWHLHGRFFPEPLAIPLTLATLLLVLEREPTSWRAVAVGALMGVGLLVRPTAFFLFAGIAVAWILAAGPRRGAAMTAVSVAVAVLVVAPWTIRNYTIDGGFVPISIQDSAIAGTFTDEAANDPENRYAFHPYNKRDADLRDPSKRLSDTEIRSRLMSRMRAYIREHPDAVPKALFYNGIVRFWDLRRPGYSLAEVRFQGPTRWVKIVGLCMYYVLAALALVGLWRARARKALVWPLVAIALASCVVFLGVGATRYRAPLEPVIVILACSAVLGSRYSRPLGQ